MRKKIHNKSIKSQVVFFVFSIMALSSFITSCVLFLAYQVHTAYPNRGRAPLFLMLMISLMFISILIAIHLYRGMSHIFLNPIRSLYKATKEIAKGNYNVRVAHTDVGLELSKLIASFNMMARELDSVEILKHDFINYFSHEFKTPIVSISGFSRQLKNGNLTSEKQEEYLDIISKESDRLIKLASNVLILTELENQAIVRGKTTFSLDEQIRHCILLLESSWNIKKIDFNIDLNETSWYGNQDMMSQLWINLLSNAIYYSHEGGQIDISCKVDAKSVKVKIKDYGIGMKDTVREKIFDKFYQGDESHEAKGNGLGLSIVGRIIELAKGKIIVKSQVGKGSEFLVYLPNEKVEK